MWGFLTDNLAILALLLLTLIVLLVLGLVVWAAVQGAGSEARDKATAPPAVRQMNLDSLKLSFRRAVELIEANLATRSERYKLSWTLVLNEDGDTGELPLLAAGIPSALSTDSALSAQALGITWNFFDQGVAIQLQGTYLGDPDDDSAAGNKVWDEFLGLCRAYRPDRPFDAVVLAVPAQRLLTREPQAELALAARVKAIHRRLWLAQNRLALQFPVSLVITGCEAIPGFTAFAQALPEAMRRSMLGWSSPYELGAPFQGQWIDTGMDEVTRDVQDACAELCALELSGQDSADYFLLPTELERLRHGLKLFAEELMRPSAYHEPFVLRGFYLTGDCSAAAALVAQGQPGAPGGDTGDVLAAKGAQEPDPLAIWGLASESMPPSDLPDTLEREPAFLRDVFEKKIFVESGLVRASRVQRLRRPALGRALGWGLAALPLVWAGGLVYGSVRLHSVGADIEAALRQLARDNPSLLSGQLVDPAQLRTRTVSTLALMEQVDAGLFSSVFMPGSWPLLDPMHERLADRLERGFAAHFIEPLRLGAYARMSELTGVPTDPTAGSLVVDGACTLPSGFEAQVAAAERSGLNPQDLPEFAALLQFAARIDEIDQAILAMQRLTQGPDAPQGEDLKRVVRTFLGAELGGDFKRAAQLFRDPARSAAPLSIDPMRQAAACSFAAAAQALRTRLFDDNDLLLAEEDLSIQLQALSGHDSGWQNALKGWSEVLDTLRQQEAWMLPGKGAWMQGRSLLLGPGWDTLMQRMALNGLIGRDAVLAAQRQNNDAFGRFQSAWATALDSGAGLVWVDKEGRWAFTQERANLRDGLQVVLAMPALKPGGRQLPDIPPGASVGWDRLRLDQALTMVETHKKIQADVLPQLPASAREGVDAMVRGALAGGLVDLLSQAVIVSARGGLAPLVGAPERSRVVRARLLLDEWGARAESEQLGLLLTRDALARLKGLDDSLRQSDLYQPRDADFRAWSGDKSPLTVAFGVNDIAALSAYAAQQQTFIENLTKEAEALLHVFDESSTEPLVQRWRAIANDLGRYRLKSPSSSLAILEQFILSGASDLDMHNCAERLRQPPRRVNDFFAERLVALQTGLASRCQALRATETQERWNHMAEAFNRDLAARAPFRVTNVPERPAAESEEVLAVLRSFDAVHRLMGTRPPTSPSVRRFDEQMERVRAFMAPLALTEAGAAAGYDLMVEFRANTGAELEGNKIIDWTVSVGGQIQRWREPPKPLRWEPGQPVLVSLRLARDGPVLPRADPTQPALSVEDRTVNFRFSDPWALYSLIGGQREPDTAGRPETRAQLLRFEFPLVPLVPVAADAGSAQPEAPKARVFLRLTVSPAGKRTPLVWPLTFPTRAPEWGAP